MTDTFPRQYARTQRFTLGEPRDVSVSDDGTRVIFARSRSGNDPVNCLWVADALSGEETLVADPSVLLGASNDEDLPAEERARRERLREGAGGITSYALDRSAQVAAFALGGQLFLADLIAHSAQAVEVNAPVFDPRPSPSGAHIAYVHGAAVWVTNLAGHTSVLADEPGAPDTVSFGRADFIAAEEMGRQRGFWWSPGSATLAVCRVDTADVAVWHISNPGAPEQAPTAIRYPAAGTTNADTTLHLYPLDGGPRIAVIWDHTRFPYLANVYWTEFGLSITVQARDQRDLLILRVDPTTGITSTVWEDHDDQWVELVPGAGALVGDDIVVTCADRDGVRRLIVEDQAVSPIDVQVRSVLSATAAAVFVTGNHLEDALSMHVYRWTVSGFEALTSSPGVHTAAVGGETVVIRWSSLAAPGGNWRLPSGGVLKSFAEVPLVTATPNISASRRRRVATAVLLPHNHDGGSLPVLVDPYGGPHAQRVVRSHNTFLSSQWFADQGFAVVVADGRGTPGLGSIFERSVHHDLATGVLDDQIEALNDAAELHGCFDLGRVAIRGWSFGGYLAALAVMRRPDVFHAAIAGASVTEWRLYDTHYTERYLGNPIDNAEVYDANSLLPLAAQLIRPLLLVHGLADDNVVAAHTLQLSSALLAAGKPHEVLPLVGVSHMTPQEVVAENLLLHQLEFLRRSLPATR